MKILDAISSNVLKDIREEVTTFTNDLLADYLKSAAALLKNDPEAVGAKDIYDAVWGTISLNPGEIIIVDSPLIQRLRKINHLGLAGYLFPGADYSRFEHTLGVLDVATRIGNKIIKDKNYQHITSDNTSFPIQVLRLAAIFHDAGHLFSSHASERFFEGPFYSRKDLVLTTKRFLMKKTNAVNIKLSEILSVFMVTSPAVIDLISLAWPYTGANHPTAMNYNEISGQIAALILGVPVNWIMLPLSGIINGAIDADKCDYLARDSQRTGVPVAVDLYRVIQKLKVINALPRDLGSVWDDQSESESTRSFLLGIALSAIRSVEEIVVSRTLMHEKIYYHHKIVTTEHMLLKALQLLDESGFETTIDFKTLLDLTDEDIFSAKVYILFEKLNQSFGKSPEYDENKFKRACRLLRNISERKLLKRACAISNEYLKPIRENVNIGRFLTDVFEKISVEENAKFVQSVIGEIENILKLTDRLGTKPEDLDDTILIVSTPEVMSSDLNMPVEVGERIRWYREFFQGEIWDNSRKVGIRCHYLVAPESIRYEACIATEKILFDKYGISLDEDASSLSKLRSSKLLEIKRRLAGVGYYKPTLPLIPNELIINAVIQKQIEDMVKRWQIYQGPKGAVDVPKTIGFLKQFYYLSEDPEDLIDGVIRILERVHIFGRDAIVSSFLKVFRTLEHTHGISITSLKLAVLGGPRDSSTHISYYMNDVTRKIGEKLDVRSIDETLSQTIDTTDVILFIEDSFWSGKQIVSIFQELCGLEPKDRELPESHCKPLNKLQADRLCKTRCWLCFGYGNPASQEFVNTKMRELGLQVRLIWANSFPREIFSQNDHPFKSNDQFQRVRSCFQNIGVQVLRSRKKEGIGFKPGWEEKKIQECSLGYNDAQQTLVLQWNTPTSTLTALWAEGELEDGTHWTPLFPRQSK